MSLYNYQAMDNSEDETLDTARLEKSSPSPVMINIVKFFSKLIIGSLGVASIAYSDSCSNEISDALLVSSILLLFESFLLATLVSCKYKSANCKKCASYFVLVQIALDILADLFYLGWGIYFIVLYFSSDSCEEYSDLANSFALAMVIYFLLSLFLMICCCGAKLCTCLSALISSGNTRPLSNTNAAKET
jgi:hypothetical protein